MTFPTPLDLTSARGIVWTALRASYPLQTAELSADLLTIVAAQLLQGHEQLEQGLAQQKVFFDQALAALAADHRALLDRFNILAERERREHAPVSGAIKFVPGQPVRGEITFTASP